MGMSKPATAHSENIPQSSQERKKGNTNLFLIGISRRVGMALIKSDFLTGSSLKFLLEKSPQCSLIKICCQKRARIHYSYEFENYASIFRARSKQKDPRAETESFSHSFPKPIQTFLRNDTEEVSWNYPAHRKNANPGKGSW